MIDPLHETSAAFERLASRRLLTHAIRYRGETRDALVYHPRHARRRGGLPLVLVFHGGASNPESIARKSEMHKLAESEEFIVAYPRGTEGAAGLTWQPSGTKNARSIDDIGFVRALVTDLCAHYDVDARRIYATGFSIGGSLVYDLACALSEDMAAVAIVSGAMTSDHCRPVRPVPLLHIHGTRDKRVPLEGGRGTETRRAGEWRPVREAIDRWRTINECSEAPQVQRIGRLGVTGYRSAGAADVDLWLVEGIGHVWPGGRRKTEAAEELATPSAKGNTSVFAATPAIWTFFAAHPLPRIAPADWHLRRR